VKKIATAILLLLVSISTYAQEETPLKEDTLEEVTVQSTRTTRTISNVPTRVETIELEEIDEKTNMRPSNVAMLLHESTGIQVQQTSATSGNSNIRLQGLDGRYTQLLKDGFPNFGNFASGLSVLEIPPLDLKQVEVIKGPVSPLFGGGAIAGVVNFISRTPGAKPEINFILNQSNIGQSNSGVFASGRNKKTGYTLLALYNRQKEYDVDDDEFTEVPKSNEFTIHPKLFLYPSQTSTIIIGTSFTTGDRIGGDMKVIKNKPDNEHQYFERNKTVRSISTFEWNKKLNGTNPLIVKQSFAVFDREITLPLYNFSGINFNSYTDVSYLANKGKHSLVTGVNFIHDKFREKESNSGRRDNKNTIAGLYGQYTWDASDKIILESGLRLDNAHYNNKLYSKSEIFLLPRVSLLVKYNSKLTSRIGVGMGYKTPTIFTEETETIQYRNVEQLNNVHSEKSYGGTADINYRTYVGDELSFSFNHMFFYTWIDDPLVLTNNVAGNYIFVNAEKPLETKGMETNARLVFKEHYKLFLGYTFTESKAKYSEEHPYLTRVPKHKLNTALIYEKEGVIKLGLEGYFTGKQHLSDGTMSPAFSEFGFMAEKAINRFSIFVNFENFTDTRQSKYKNVVNGSHLDPVFDEIWTHAEGFVINGGVKIKFQF
jgi:iron complex outermembrane receptor protein/outer membrane receptor for ferrienterochelin and colicins